MVTCSGNTAGLIEHASPPALLIVLGATMSGARPMRPADKLKPRSILDRPCRRYLRTMKSELSWDFDCSTFPTNCASLKLLRDKFHAD